MDLNFAIFIFAFALTIVAIVAIVYNKDRVANKAVDGLIRLVRRNKRD